MAHRGGAPRGTLGAVAAGPEFEELARQMGRSTGSSLFIAVGRRLCPLVVLQGVRQLNIEAELLPELDALLGEPCLAEAARAVATVVDLDRGVCTQHARERSGATAAPRTVQPAPAVDRMLLAMAQVAAAGAAPETCLELIEDRLAELCIAGAILAGSDADAACGVESLGYQPGDAALLMAAAGRSALLGVA